MNLLDDEENRRELEAWVANLLASFDDFEAQIAQSMPRDPVKALARLEQQSAASAPVIDRAVRCFSLTGKWPENLSDQECFYLELRIELAKRIVNGMLSGAVTDPDIINLVGADNANFTERMLTKLWESCGPSFLKVFADDLPRYISTHPFG